MTKSAAALIAAGLTASILAGCGPFTKASAARPSPTLSPTPSKQGGRAQGSGVAGTVVSIGQGRLTVQDRSSGKDVTVTYDTSVPITARGGPATTADLQKGALVVVRGQTAPDGTVKAEAIMLAPAGTRPPSP